MAALVPDGASVPLLYGGSVKAANAAEILARPDVDGALVGGSCLQAAEFWAIYQAGGAT
jgi:triosephosphate isomerase